MSCRAMPVVVLLLVSGGLVGCDRAEQFTTDTAQQWDVSYADDVAPILEEHCVVCHVAGQQGAEATGLRLDSYESLMEGSRFGPVIDPGSARTSSLHVLLTGKANLTVNMPHGGDPLPAEEIEIVRIWIDNGAVDN